MLSRRRNRGHDRGFTLVELLVAMVIMGVAIVVLIAAMGNIFVDASYHRGYSRLETNMRNFAEGLQQKASFRSGLNGAIDDAVNQITISDPVSSFGNSRTTRPAPIPTNFPFYITVDSETMRVTGMVGSDPTTSKVLKVDRGYGGTTSTRHADKAAVIQLFGCPDPGNADTATSDTGDYGSKHIGYLYPSGFKSSDSKITVSITNVAYWDPISPPVGQSGQFDWTQSQCWTPPAAVTSIGYSNVCPGGQVQPQCDLGLELVTLSATDTSSTTATSASMQVLVRRGSQ